MNTLLAIDDGLTNGNYNAADIFFLIGVALAVLAGLAYVAGFPATERAPEPGRYARYSHWAAAFVALAIASVSFALFLL